MKARLLFCVFLLYSVSTACANLPFLELDTTPGLRPILLPAEDDGVSAAVSPPQRLPIWGTFYSDFFVMANGVIYIGTSHGECCPTKFSKLPSDTTPFIAPYWIDSDPSVRGNVSYEVHTGNSLLLQQVSDYISSNQSVDFRGTWMMVAYWWDVPELFLEDTRNTYQGVLITDGLSSYAVFIYRCGHLESGATGGIGYYINSTIFMEHAQSLTNTSSSVACRSPLEWSTLVYRLNAPAEAPISLHVVDVNFTSVSITWESGVCDYCPGGISGYLVRYWDQEEESVVTVSRIQGVNHTTLHGLKPFTKYSIEVAAVNNEIMGAYSSPITAETRAKGTDLDENADICLCTNDEVDDVSSIQPEVTAGDAQCKESDGVCIGCMVGAFLGGVLLCSILGAVLLIAILCRKRRKSFSPKSPNHEVITSTNLAYGTVMTMRSDIKGRSGQHTYNEPTTEPNLAYGSFTNAGSSNINGGEGGAPTYETITL